ncbi:MAG TPA: hypothetical protein VFT45_03835 [Longimicrobium sp.]|nr:hypothetical protein [Longimicrobium sp.]
MNKLSLSLDALRVESFDTTPAERKQKGTVFGEQCTCYTACSCPGCPTCGATCYVPGNGNTCEHTCAAEYTCDTCMGTCANYPETTCTGARPCYE